MDGRGDNLFPFSALVAGVGGEQNVVRKIMHVCTSVTDLEISVWGYSTKSQTVSLSAPEQPYDTFAASSCCVLISTPI